MATKKKNKELGWESAMEHAKTLVKKGNLDRKEHMVVFLKMLESFHKQDHLIALALMSLFITFFKDDFDSELELTDVISHGNILCPMYWNEYGTNVLYDVLTTRQVPAAWIDRISDEEPKYLRMAFAKALDEMAKIKSIDESRILGMLIYFLDEPQKDVRTELIKVLVRLGERNPEKVFYFIKEHENKAGSDRLALLRQVRDQLGWKDR